jgi:2-oxoglutarate ferredoxin oxidoreductase subunit beta
MQGCGFVARGFAGETEHLKDILVRAVRHRGLSYVDIIQPCITWGTHPISWYRERVTKLGREYDPRDRSAALNKAMEASGNFVIGVLYEAPPGNLFADRFRKDVTNRPITELGMQDPEKIGGLLSGFRATA